MKDFPEGGDPGSFRRFMEAQDRYREIMTPSQERQMLLDIRARLFELSQPEMGSDSLVHGSFPDGLTLLMHPATRHRLWQAPDLSEYTQWTTSMEQDPASRFLYPLPVLVTNEGLQPGEWKLALVREPEVLMSGRLP